MNATARNYYRDSNDPRKNYPTAAKDAHLRLLAELSNVIDPSVNKVRYDAIIRRLVPYMVSMLSKKAQNFIDIFESLEKLHFVEVGKYGALKKILREFDPQYVQIIENAEEEIKIIMKSHKQPKPVQNSKQHHSEDSFVSTLSEGESHMWVGKIPRKIENKILTEEDLENFSEAIIPTKLEVVRTAFWLSSADLDQMINKSRGSLTIARFLILLKWQEKNGGTAYVNDIINRFSESLEMDAYSINIVKARGALEKMTLEMNNKK
ncbi:Hypothetical predicted protein [Mytilus galloprovincialis]|uniref:Death domain-containing protein n=1 Tax=Mytilus galloprovincialis TaxID=29158 RepID=A0A8B6DUR6_MYTGA|nr:Hypothetical predicted protein [Mytilus galloprovincialis]